MIDSSSTIENYTNKSTTTSTAAPTKLKANVSLTADKKLIKTVSNSLQNQTKSSIGDTSTGTSYTTSSSISLTDKTYQITNSLNEACNLLNEKSNLFQTNHVIPQPPPPPPPSQKLKIVCKSSGYNVKEICNNLYDIDEHSNKDLIVDYFFSDNYHLEPNSNPTPTATVVQNNSSNVQNGPGKLVVVWNNSQSNSLGKPIFF